MQVVPTTFAAYAMPGFDKDIWDPLSNILASIRYTLAAYKGSLTAGWLKSGGYEKGIGKINLADLIQNIGQAGFQRTVFSMQTIQSLLGDSATDRQQ